MNDAVVKMTNILSMTVMVVIQSTRQALPLYPLSKDKKDCFLTSVPHPLHLVSSDVVKGSKQSQHNFEQGQGQSPIKFMDTITQCCAHPIMSKPHHNGVIVGGQLKLH